MNVGMKQLLVVLSFCSTCLGAGELGYRAAQEIYEEVDSSVETAWRSTSGGCTSNNPVRLTWHDLPPKMGLQDKAIKDARHGNQLTSGSQVMGAAIPSIRYPTICRWRMSVHHADWAGLSRTASTDQREAHPLVSQSNINQQTVTGLYAKPPKKPRVIGQAGGSKPDASSFSHPASVETIGVSIRQDNLKQGNSHPGETHGLSTQVHIFNHANSYSWENPPNSEYCNPGVIKQNDTPVNRAWSSASGIPPLVLSSSMVTPDRSGWVTSSAASHDPRNKQGTASRDDRTHNIERTLLSINPTDVVPQMPSQSAQLEPMPALLLKSRKWKVPDALASRRRTRSNELSETRERRKLLIEMRSFTFPGQEKVFKEAFANFHDKRRRFMMRVEEHSAIDNFLTRIVVDDKKVDFQSLNRFISFITGKLKTMHSNIHSKEGGLPFTLRFFCRTYPNEIRKRWTGSVDADFMKRFAECVVAEIAEGNAIWQCQNIGKGEDLTALAVKISAMLIQNGPQDSSGKKIGKSKLTASSRKGTVLGVYHIILMIHWDNMLAPLPVKDLTERIKEEFEFLKTFWLNGAQEAKELDALLERFSTKFFLSKVSVNHSAMQIAKEVLHWWIWKRKGEFSSFGDLTIPLRDIEKASLQRFLYDCSIVEWVERQSHPQPEHSIQEYHKRLAFSIYDPPEVKSNRKTVFLRALSFLLFGYHRRSLEVKEFGVDQFMRMIMTGISEKPKFQSVFDFIPFIIRVLKMPDLNRSPSEIKSLDYLPVFVREYPQEMREQWTGVIDQVDSRVFSLRVIVEVAHENSRWLCTSLGLESKLGELTSKIAEMMVLKATENRKGTDLTSETLRAASEKGIRIAWYHIILLFQWDYLSARSLPKAPTPRITQAFEDIRAFWSKGNNRSRQNPGGQLTSRKLDDPIGIFLGAFSQPRASLNERAIEIANCFLSWWLSKLQSPGLPFGYRENNPGVELYRFLEDCTIVHWVERQNGLMPRLQ